MTLPEHLAGLEREYFEVERNLADPATIADQKRYADIARRYNELGEIVTRLDALREAESDLEVAREMFTDADGDDREMLRAEVDKAEASIGRLEEEIKLRLLPRDPERRPQRHRRDPRCRGGEEANLFARDLFEMYRSYASRAGLKFEGVLGAQSSDLGGFAEVTFQLSGDHAWSRMKFEGGPHRVQRVPVTESQGRVHTSSATVTVLPEADEIDVDIDLNDLQIDVYRSSGPGGQSVNTTDSAVRITHKPTGLVVAMQDEKSQIQNRAKALVVLRSRLLKQEQDRQQAELSSARRDQVGGGGRSEKVRTYNYKENRVTDHRIPGLTRYNLDKVLAGELDEFIDALMADERSRQLQAVDSSSVPGA